MNTKQYLTLFFSEKRIDNVNYQIEDSSGVIHFLNTDIVIENIMNTNVEEQNQIAHVLRRIDFRNGSVQHFLKYLATTMVLHYSKAA